MNRLRITFDIETIPNSECNTNEVLSEELTRLRALTEKTPGREFLPAVHPAFCQVVCICAKITNETTGHVTLKNFADADEKKVLEGFSEMLRNIQSKDYFTVFVGWNSLDFDAPIIRLRSLKHGVQVTGGAWQYFVNLKRFAKEPHFDVMQWLANWQSNAKLSLRTAAAMFNLPDPKAGLLPDQIPQAIADGHMQDVIDYCWGDVTTTDALYLRVKDGL